MYNPENSSNASGSSGEYVIHAGGGPLVMAAKLASTVTVKAIETQRWPCRTHSFNRTTTFL